MKFLVVLTFFLSLSLALPTELHRAYKVPPPEASKEIVQFLKGFAVGMETILGDPTLCAKDIDKMVVDFHNAFIHIGDGIHKKSISLIKQGIKELAEGLHKVEAAFRDCGLEKAAEDIAEIVAEIKSGQLLTFIQHEIVHIIHHGRELIHLFKDMCASWKAKQYYECGVDVGEVVGILLEGKRTPSNVKPQDLALFVRGLAEGMGETIGDPTTCIHEVDIAIAQFNAAWMDIKDGLKKISIKIIKRAIQEFADGLDTVASAFVSCGLDRASELIKALVKEIKAGKLLEVLLREAIHIICHGKELVHLFKSASENWRSGAFQQSGRDSGKIVAFILNIPLKN